MPCWKLGGMMSKSIIEFKGSARDFGRQIMLGFLDVAATLLTIGFILCIFLSIIKPIDDCDRSKFDRCEMRILTDNKTGIEYLVTQSGDIIRRGDLNE